MTIALIPSDGVNSEVLTVSAGAASLSSLPNIDSLNIPGFVKVYTTPSKGQYRVQANSLVLTFNTSDNGATPTANYLALAAVGVTTTKVNEVIEAVNELEGETPDLILTTKGDIMGHSTVAARVPVGANDLPLVADSSQSLGIAYKALPIAGGGTGQVTQTAAMNALSPTSVKGDILVDNGTDLIKLGVGSNDQVLTADSTQAAGVKWSAVAGSGQPAGSQMFTSSGNFTVPTGVTKIRARLWAGGGGGGGGGNSLFTSDGADGLSGANTSIKDAGHSARGGLFGGGCLATTTGNASTPANQTPSIASDLIRFGTLFTFPSAFSSPIEGDTYLRSVNQVLQTGFSLRGAAVGTIAGGAGATGQANTGVGGGGGGSGDVTGQNDPGAAGGHGEYAEVYLTVTPGEILPVVIGAGGAGGAGGTAGLGTAGGTGGAGGTGFAIVEW